MELTNPITEDGSQTVVPKPGREYVFAAQGTFGGGTLSLEWSFDGTTWTPVADSNGPIAFTEGGGTIFAAPAGNLRVTLADSTDAEITAFFTEHQ